MKQVHNKLIALCISTSLCSALLSGCGAGSGDAGTQTQAPVQTEVQGETQAPAETQAQTSAGTQEQTAADSDTATASTQDGSEDSVYVEPIAGISGDFICGMDASAVLAEENSGVIYYNFDGEEQDVFETLSQSGVNYIRLRVWNDPYDEDGNGYGGGNNDVATAVELGMRATEYGMKVCIDFHYSDFWADPGRQVKPKAWKDYTAEQKATAVGIFTREILNTIIAAGTDVGMVQVGNETTTAVCGETDWA